MLTTTRRAFPRILSIPADQARSPTAGIFGLLALFVGGLNVEAALITSANTIQSPCVIDLSQFNTDVYLGTIPLQVGGLADRDVTATGVGPFQRIVATFGFTIGDNGEWTTARDGYASSNSVGGSITFTFNDGPVAAVGGLMNYSPNPGTLISPVRIEALDITGNLLESFELPVVAPISTPGGVDEGAFRGISRPSADIGAFRFTGTFTLLDDLTFAQSIPEPRSVAMWFWLMPIMAGAYLLRRRSKRGRFS